MSRSKRSPYWTEGYKGIARSKSKKESNNRVKNTEDITNGASYKKIYNSYDICDYKWYDLKNKKVARK